MADDSFAPSNSTAQQPHLYRPVPRRTFPGQRIDTADSPTHDFTAPQETPPSATADTRRSSDFLAQLNARLLRTYNSRNSEDEEREGPGSAGLGLSSPRNKSFLNMTSSTLYGIYDEVDPNASSSAETPWGTGAETPAHTAMGYHAWDSGVGSPDGGLSMKTRARAVGAQKGLSKERRKSMSPGRQKSGTWKVAVVGSKLAALFLFGVVYGLIVSHLHDTRQLAAVRMEVDKESWIYLASWGFAGVALGSLLPYVELTWGTTSSPSPSQEEEEEDSKDPESPISEQINDVVRSVAAFVGIAFAIRRLPWQSTLQLTFTLALVNPALWYILDRSKPGLSCSLIVTSILTSFIFLSNPNVLPSPPLPSTTNTTHPVIRKQVQYGQEELFAGVVSYDNLAVVTWVGSVLFCSCVCFGSIGRRLAVMEEPGRRK